MKQKVDHRQVDHRLAALGQRFVILAQATIAAQPSEGAFHGPTLGQHHEAAQARPLDDLHHTTEHRLGLRHETTRIPRVSPDQLPSAEAADHFQQHFVAPVAVLHRGAVHHRRQDQAQRQSMAGASSLRLYLRAGDGAERVLAGPVAAAPTRWSVCAPSGTPEAIDRP